MRIPSQFNDSSLYGRGKRPPPDSAQSYRRLIRLLVALVLIVMVMRQASQPAMYEVFFGDPDALGVSDAPETVVTIDSGTQAEIDEPTNPSEVGPGGTGTGNSEFDLVQIEDLEAEADRKREAAALVNAMPIDLRRQWHGVLARDGSGSSNLRDPSMAASDDRKLTADSVDETIRLLDSERSIDSSSSNKWKSFFREQNDPILAKSMLEALDRAAIDRVVDGSVWRSEDYDAFYRQLSQAAALAASETTAVAVLPLLQQPEVYRGQAVRVRGRVARSERLEAAENPFGVRQYWQLWLEPRDGGDRPLVAIVPEVDRTIAAVGPGGEGGDRPTVWIIGRFFKRLAYRSSIGADLAPVVIGYATAKPIPASKIGETSRETLQPAGSEYTGFRLMLGIVAACLIGIALAAVTMWRTAVSAKRSREMRQSKQRMPNDLLREIGNDEE